MSFIERPRFSCMLGGALATLTSLPRVIPIIHGAQGCVPCFPGSLICAGRRRRRRRGRSLKDGSRHRCSLVRSRYCSLRSSASLFRRLGQYRSRSSGSCSRSSRWAPRPRSRRKCSRRPRSPRCWRGCRPR